MLQQLWQMAARPQPGARALRWFWWGV